MSESRLLRGERWNCLTVVVQAGDMGLMKVHLPVGLVIAPQEIDKDENKKNDEEG